MRMGREKIKVGVVIKLFFYIYFFQNGRIDSCLWHEIIGPQRQQHIPIQRSERTKTLPTIFHFGSHCPYTFFFLRKKKKRYSTVSQ